MGVVSIPSAVTGLVAISIMAEMTFMPGRHGSSNRSQTEGASGLAWRLISSVTVFVAMRRVSLCLLGRGVTARARLDELGVDFFIFESWTFGRAGEACLGGLQELFIVAVREVRLVVRASGLATEHRTKSNCAREFQHVLQLARKGEAGVGPLTAVG